MHAQFKVISDCQSENQPIVHTSMQISSLSTIVLNSRDWYEIIWLPEISRFKNQPCNRFYQKKPAGMHWYGCNDAVPWLNEATS